MDKIDRAIYEAAIHLDCNCRGGCEGTCTQALILDGLREAKRLIEQG